MRFLLVGGIGYVGGRLAAHLKQQGHYVCVTTRRPVQQAPSWLKADDVAQVNPYDAATLKTSLSSIDVVIDLAAPDEVKSNQDPKEALKAGREATTTILQAVSECPHPPAVIYLSTFHVYGTNARGRVDETTIPAPIHPYAVGKYEGERVMQEFRQKKKMEGLCVRLSNAFGAPAGIDVPRWTLVFNDLCRQAVAQQKLVLKSAGKQRRNFISLSDAVRALEFLSLNRSSWPKDGIIHVGSIDHWSILEAANKVAECTKDLFGYLPSVIVPKDAPAEKGSEFEFSVERLRQLGFTWTSSWEEEIKATLTLCQAANRSISNHA